MSERRFNFNETLARLVEDNPHLYDNKDKNYKDHVLRESTWMDISKQLGQPPETCMKRWRSLRDRFAKEKRKLENSNLVSSTWDQFNQLSFLQGHLRPRLTLGNLDEDPELTMQDVAGGSVIANWNSHGDLDGDNLMGKSLNDTNLSAFSPPTMIRQHRKRKRESQNDEQDMLSIILENNHVNNHTPHSNPVEKTYKEDIYDNYGKIIALKLRDMPTKEADEAMIFILQHLTSVT
uniref:MADF domain-containing protein n=1 Tax=Ciona savignyi TaxID=51511 RepID=H2Z364_CIOSA